MQEYTDVRFTERSDGIADFFGAQCQQSDHSPVPTLTVDDWARIEAAEPGVCPQSIAITIALYSPTKEHRFTEAFDKYGERIVENDQPCFCLDESNRSLLETYDLYLRWPARLKQLCAVATIQGPHSNLGALRAWMIYIGDNMESILTEAPTVGIYCASCTNLCLALRSKKETPYEIYRDHRAKYPLPSFESDVIAMMLNLPVSLLEQQSFRNTDIAHSATFAIISAYIRTQAILACTVTSDSAAVGCWCPPNSIFYSNKTGTDLMAFNVGGAITVVTGNCSLSLVYHYIQAMRLAYPDNIYIQSAHTAISLPDDNC